MDDNGTQIRFTGERDTDGRWLSTRTDGATTDTLRFATLADAASLAAAEGWTGGVSVSSTTYEAMLDAGAASPEGALPANVVRTDS